MLRQDALDLLLAERGAAVLPVAAGDTSMLPHLRGGDLLLVRPADPNPRPGDVLVFRQQDYLAVHRYLGPARTPKGQPCLRARGDGRSALDPPVGASAVVGRVAAFGRDGAWRSFEGTGARAYARLIAWHDLVWAALAVALGRLGAGGLAIAVDRGLLRLGAPLVFPLCHSRIAPPAAPGTDATV